MNILSGKDAFILHSRYGFLIEITEEICAERGWKVDKQEFLRLMAIEREKSRRGSKWLQSQ